MGRLRPGLAYRLQRKKRPYAGEKSEAAIGVEPMMEVLQTSGGRAHGWSHSRERGAQPLAVNAAETPAAGPGPARDPNDPRGRLACS